MHETPIELRFLAEARRIVEAELKAEHEARVHDRALELARQEMQRRAQPDPETLEKWAKWGVDEVSPEQALRQRARVSGRTVEDQRRADQEAAAYTERQRQADEAERRREDARRLRNATIEAELDKLAGR